MTRDEYMKNPTWASHRQYCAAVLKTAGIALDPASPFIARCRKALEAGDEHLNTVPLAEWDRKALAAQTVLCRAFVKHGDHYSLGGGVCVMKEAARQAAEKYDGTEGQDRESYSDDQDRKSYTAHHCKY